MSYQITTNFIAGLPQDPYRNGIGAYEGVVAHSTADPEATAMNIHNFEVRNWQNAFVQYVVDWSQIIYQASTSYICYGAGHTANQRFVSVELCETSDPNKFNESYARYTWLLAKILFDRKLGVKQCSTFWTHNDITTHLGGTTHTDPVQYLSSHGVSIAKLVADVTDQYNSMANPVQAPTSPSVASGGIGTIKILAKDLWYYDKPDWNAKKAMVHAGEVFTVVQVLTVSGSKMYKLKSGTYITANPNYVQFR